MIFFNKDKNDKKVIEERILAELKDFSNNYDSLKKIKSLASQKFGENWSEELTSIIASKSPEEKELYSNKLSLLLDYKSSVDLYKKAAKFIHLDFILSNDLSEAREIAKSKDEIATALSKFKTSGEELNKKFKDKLDELSAISEEDSLEKHEISKEEMKLDTSEEKEVENNEVKEVIKEDLASVTAEADIKIPSGKRDILSKDENINHLSSFQEKVKVAKIKDRINTSYSTAGQSVDNSKPEEKNVNGLEWNIRHLYICDEYFRTSQNILSLVAVENNSKSLEEYKHYPLLIDLAKHIVKTVNKILAEKSSEAYKDLLSKYKKDDMRSPEEMLSYYKEQISETSNSSNLEEDEMETSEVSSEIKKQAEKLKMVA